MSTMAYKAAGCGIVEESKRVKGVGVGKEENKISYSIAPD